MPERPMRDPRNRHCVPKKQWRKWSNLAKAMFNRTYRTYMDARHVMLPPGTLLSFEQMRVLVWNAAWLAADELDALLDHVEATGRVD